VATDDNAERQTVSALGAATLRSEDLAAWVERAQSTTLDVKKFAGSNARAWKKP